MDEWLDEAWRMRKMGEQLGGRDLNEEGHQGSGHGRRGRRRGHYYTQ